MKVCSMSTATSMDFNTAVSATGNSSRAVWKSRDGDMVASPCK